MKKLLGRFSSGWHRAGQMLSDVGYPINFVLRTAAVVLVFILGVSLAIYLLEHGVFLLALLLMLSALICGASIAIARKVATKRAGIIAVVAMLFLNTALFASIHLLVYRHDGSNYAIDDRLIATGTLEHLESINIRLEDDQDLLSGLMRLRYLSQRAPGTDFREMEQEHVLSGGWRFRKRVVSTSVPTSLGTYSVQKPMVEWILTDGHIVEFDGSSAGFPSDRDELFYDLFRAQDASSTTAACNALIDCILADHETWIASTGKSIASESAMNYLDFLYYSIMATTTVGTGDISPNSTLARVFVSLQSVLSVLILSFGIEFVFAGGVERARHREGSSNSPRAV